MAPRTEIALNGQNVDAANVTQPNDRSFRAAWVLNGAVIVIDMTKAREIRRDQLRADRQPLFEALDASFMKALETADTASQATIAAEKQRLRDITSDPRIDAATTSEELKMVQVSG